MYNDYRYQKAGGWRMKDNEEKNKHDLETPDIYADRFRITVSVFGVNMTFGLSEPHPIEIDGEMQKSGTTPQVVIRTSVMHAKIIAMLLKQQIQLWEKGSETEIPIPKEVLESLKLKNVKW